MDAPSMGIVRSIFPDAFGVLESSLEAVNYNSYCFFFFFESPIAHEINDMLYCESRM